MLLDTSKENKSEQAASETKNSSSLPSNVLKDNFIAAVPFKNPIKTSCIDIIDARADQDATMKNKDLSNEEADTSLPSFNLGDNTNGTYVFL